MEMFLSTLIIYCETCDVQLDSTLVRNIMLLERLREKARKEIGDLADILEVSDDNRLKPRNILKRLMQELKDFNWIDKTMRQLEAHKRTAIVASKLPNACAIFRMLDEFAY